MTSIKFHFVISMHEESEKSRELRPWSRYISYRTYHKVLSWKQSGGSSPRKPALSCDIQWRTSLYHFHKPRPVSQGNSPPQDTHTELVLPVLSHIGQRSSHSSLVDMPLEKNSKVEYEYD